MKAVISVLLCLLSALVVVYSQSVPYISFMGTVLPNHSYIDFSLVGSNSVQCHTDLSTCCSGVQGQHRGDWYFPTGARLPFSSIESAHVYQNRQNKVVKLHRSANTVTDGIYHCDIDTRAARNDNQETVYAGLYVHGGDVAIQGNIQLRVESDLNGESPQFTLTCISTGGPATTVTWTRDSEEVSGGTTVLDNTVTAQYTHTLTVTGRLPGQYQCTVSNNKPSQDSASITVQGFLEGSTSQSGKGCTCTGQGAVAGYAVGGFVGGVLITAVMGAFILIVIMQSMRTKMHALTSLPQVPEEQKHYVPTSSNAAYGCVEGVRYTEREMFDMTSGAVEAMQGPVYETVPN